MKSESPLVPVLPPQDHSGEPSGWRFATSIGPWGPLLAEYYEVAREALPNEREFWASLVQPTSTVVEIGAGSGFISKALAEASPRLLTLVEPEREHLKLLRRAMRTWKTHSQIDIVEAFFENTKISKHNLIVFPFDSLPMITSRKQRAQLYAAIAERLVPGGKFVVHFSSPSWNENYVRETGRQSVSTYTIRSGHELRVRRLSKPISKAEFIKFISVECPEKQARENYVALTAIVQEDEVILDAASAGFKLESRFGDFKKNVFSPSEEVIFVFKKM